MKLVKWTEQTSVKSLKHKFLRNGDISTKGVQQKGKQYFSVFHI